MSTDALVKEKPLHDLLEGFLKSQRRDIQAYSGGHLNEANLYKHPDANSRKSWASSKKPVEVLLKKSEIPARKMYTAEEETMKNTILNFSMGTTGGVHKGETRVKKKSPKGAMRGPVKFDRRESVESAGSYHKADDGVLVEEIRPPEALLARSKYLKSQGWAEEDLKYDKTFTERENSFGAEKDRNLARLKHQFLPGHMEAVTRRDQFVKLKEFESNVLRKQDALETNVLSGVKAVEHLEDKLRQNLDQLQYHGYGPNFHRLQIYSNIFEDMIHESPTFGYILRTVKKEYDDYVACLLDTQTAKHRVLYEQVEQLSARGTSNPQVLNENTTRVGNQEYYAKSLLKENERLRKELAEEVELSTRPSSAPAKRPHISRDEAELELTDQIEEARANILEKLDAMNALRQKLRTEFVPSTVCTYLEQCIKDTEVEIQKMTSQKEFFERSVNEMEADLSETIDTADTTEKDSKRLWKHVNAVKSMDRTSQSASTGRTFQHNSDDDETDDKWNWYIS